MKRRSFIFFIVILFSFPSGIWAYTMEECLDCHGQGSTKSALHISEDEFLLSAHSEELECEDCHLEVVDQEHETIKGSGVVFCDDCHDEENLHGALAKQEERPKCWSCHGKHNILASYNKASTVYPANLKETCKGCHPAECGETGFFYRLTSIRIKSHKKQDFSREYAKSDCIGCHQGQAAHGEVGLINNQECSLCHMDSSDHSGIVDTIHPTIDFKPTLSESLVTGMDPLLVVVVFVIMLAGFAVRWSVIRTGKKEYRKASWSGLTIYLLSHLNILRNKSRGIAHIMIFWGVLFPLFVIILAQFNFHLPIVPAEAVSLIAELLGVALLAGTVFFLIRRLSLKDLRGPRKTILPMCILLIILFSGFMAESSRLAIISNSLVWESPFGSILSPFLPDSPLLMQVIIRVHFFAVLLLIAVLPFTFFRHLIAASWNVLYKRTDPPGKLRGVLLDQDRVGVETYRDLSWKQLLDSETCVSCGRCEENCPAFISGKPLSPRKIIQDIQKQMESRSSSPLDSRISRDEIWSCTSCMACIEHCPVFIEPLDKIMGMRAYQSMGKGKPPEEVGSLIRNLDLMGDVDGKGPSHRMDWAFNQDVPHFYSDGLKPEILLWVGCSGAFHPRYLEVARAMVSILKKAGISFGILGKEEMCCGDPARRLGEESLFLELARKNIRNFKTYNVKKIVTLCPHCFNTLKNEYPAVQNETGNGDEIRFDVFHAAEYVVDLIREKRVVPKYPLDKGITIHDPCYLGRGNMIYEAPREIIESIPEARLKELERNRENGFCCGGGGGGMWLHEHLGRRMNVIRAEEVMESGVDVLSTACPYCLTMLDDGINSIEAEKPPKVMDIIEVLARSIR